MLSAVSLPSGSASFASNRLMSRTVKVGDGQNASVELPMIRNRYPVSASTLSCSTPTMRPAGTPSTRASKAVTKTTTIPMVAIFNVFMSISHANEYRRRRQRCAEWHILPPWETWTRWQPASLVNSNPAVVIEQLCGWRRTLSIFFCFPRVNSPWIVAMTKQSEFAVLLGLNPLFSGLGADSKNRIAALCHTQYLAADEILFRKGDSGDALFG